MSRSVFKNEAEYTERGRHYHGHDDSEQEWLATGRYTFALNFVNEKDVCLDAACGSGYGSELLSGKARKVIGLDVDEHALSFAQAHHRNEKLSFGMADLTLPFPLRDECVDVVVSVETVEHVTEHEALLSEFRRVLKRGGRIVVTTVDHAVYSVRAGIRNRFHVGELTKKELLDLMSRYFSLEGIYGQIRYVPLPWTKRLGKRGWVSFVALLGVVDVFRLRRYVIKKLRLDDAVKAVNQGLSPMKMTEIEKTDDEGDDDYYQLIVVARKP